MNKRKILTMAMAIAMVAILAVGGTLAYFTDEDTADNVFTMGNVDIALDEIFNPEGTLMPDEENKTQKEVYVDNVGTEPAYVRIQYAIPSALVDAEINSYNDMLHVNMTGASIAAGEWSWLPEYAGKDAKGWTGNGLANNNTYTTTIGDVEHTVWVVTYTTPVAAGGTTATPAISNVYLDKNVEATLNADKTITYTKPFFTNGARTEVDENKVMSYTPNEASDEEGFWLTTIKVVAEGTQTNSFDDAYEALNTAFGKPTSTANPWNNYGK